MYFPLIIWHLTHNVGSGFEQIYFGSCKTEKAPTSLQRFFYLPLRSSFTRTSACNPGAFRVHHPTRTQPCQGSQHPSVRKPTFSSETVSRLWELLIQTPCPQLRSWEPWDKPQTSAALRLPQVGWLQFFWTPQPAGTLPCLYPLPAGKATGCPRIQKPCTAWDHPFSLAAPQGDWGALSGQLKQFPISLWSCRSHVTPCFRITP